MFRPACAEGNTSECDDRARRGKSYGSDLRPVPGNWDNGHRTADNGCARQVLRARCASWLPLGSIHSDVFLSDTSECRSATTELSEESRTALTCALFRVIGTTDIGRPTTVVRGKSFGLGALPGSSSARFTPMSSLQTPRSAPVSIRRIRYHEYSTCRKHSPFVKCTRLNFGTRFSKGSNPR